MQTPSLFDEPHIDTHRLAFEAWLEEQCAMGLLQRPASIQVYRDMWGSFAAWCLGQSPAVRLDELTVGDLQAFQAARLGKKSADMSLSPRHALRLLRLVDRVLHHRAAQRGEAPNTAAADCIAAQPEVRFAEAADADPLPDYLSTTEASRLIAFVSQARPRPAATDADRDAHASLSWQVVRNRTSVALQLGGGLTPADVRALTLDSPRMQGGRSRERPWKLSVPGNGNSPGRETPIAPWAGELLHHWLQVRTDAKIPGVNLFPSTRTGKPWSKIAQYLAAKGVLEEAGVDSGDGGSYRLRHTFALRQLRRGTSTEQVARWLGIEPEAMGRYGRLLLGNEEVV